MESFELILLAAGRGTRVGAAKQFADLCGKPVMVHALAPFEELDYVGMKYIAVQPDTAELTDRLLRKHGISNFTIVAGGPTRQASVRLALQHVRSKRLITHNAALPFVTKRLIDNVVRPDYPCVTTVTPLEVIVCRGEDFAEQVIPPERLQVINTPQSFHTDLFRELHQRAHTEGLAVRTDCELMLHFGQRVKFVRGDPENFKITTSLDLMLAHTLASKRLES